jgi:hypothetical protein
MSNGWPYGDSDPQGPDGWDPQDEPFASHSPAVLQWPAGEPGPDEYRYEPGRPAADAGGDPWTAGQEFAAPWASEREPGGPRAPGYGQWTPPGPPAGGRPILVGPPRSAAVGPGPDAPARQRGRSRRGRGQAGSGPEQVPDADYEWFRYLGEGRPGRPDSDPGDQGFSGAARRADGAGYGGSRSGGGQSDGDRPGRPGADAPAEYLERGGRPDERPGRAAPDDAVRTGRSGGPVSYPYLSGPYPSGATGEFAGRSSGRPGEFPGSLVGQPVEPGGYPGDLPGWDTESYARPPYPTDDSGPPGGYRRGVMDSAEYASPLYPPPGAARSDPGTGRGVRRGDEDARGGHGTGQGDRSGDGYRPSRPSGPPRSVVASRPAAWAGPLAESGYDSRPAGRPGPGGALGLATRPGQDSGQFAVGVAPADADDSGPITDSGPIAGAVPSTDSGPMAAVAAPRRRGERDNRERPRRHASHPGVGRRPEDERAGEVASRPDTGSADPGERRRPGRREDEAAGEVGRGSAGPRAAQARQVGAPVTVGQLARTGRKRRPAADSDRPARKGRPDAAQAVQTKSAPTGMGSAPDLAPGPAKADPAGRPGKIGRRGKSGKSGQAGKSSAPAKTSASVKSGRPVKSGGPDGGAVSPAARRGSARKGARSGRHLTFGLVRIPLRAVVVSGSAMVAVLAAAAYLLLLAPQPTHSITVPARLGRYVRQSSVASATALQLRSKIVAGARGEVKNVVGAVYEQLTGPGTSTGPQVVVFIGGNLTGSGSAGGFISGFKSELHGSFSTSAGRLGGQAACAPASQGRLAECAWADNDTFGVVVSATLHARALAAEMRQMRPLIEHRIR